VHVASLAANKSFVGFNLPRQRTIKGTGLKRQTDAVIDTIAKRTERPAAPSRKRASEA
jgi:hypothetical protein